MSKKNCMNCMHRVPTGDGAECLKNQGMRVNERMHCDEWRSDDTTTMTEPPVFATSVTSISTEKAVIH